MSEKSTSSTKPSDNSGTDPRMEKRYIEDHWYELAGGGWLVVRHTPAGEGEEG